MQSSASLAEMEEQMRPVGFDANITAVGLGAMGANAAWRLAERGLKIIGIERCHPGRVRGSSHGNARVLRVACLEHPNLVPLVHHSRERQAVLGQKIRNHCHSQYGRRNVRP